MKLDLRLLRLAFSARGDFLATLALGFAGGLLTIGQAQQLSEVVAAVFLRGQNLAAVRQGLGWLLLVICLRAGAAWGMEVTAHQVAAQAKSALRNRLLDHRLALGPLPLAPFPIGEGREVRGGTGALTHLLTEGLDALDAYFGQYLPQVFLASFIPLTILGVVFPLDPLSGLILLLTGPLIPLFMALIGAQADARTRRQWQSLSRLAARFLDALQGLVTLKLLGRSRDFAADLDQASEDYRRKTMEVLRISFLSALTLELLSTLSTAVVAVQIGLRLLYGYLHFEQAFFVLLLAPEFYLPLRLLGLRFHAGMAGATAGEEAFAWLAIQPAVRHQGPSVKPAPRAISRVVCDQVSFVYPDGTTALQEVSFTLEPGTLTALVGPSGAGKSTLAALLLGFIQPTSGAIHAAFAGHPASISWVPQHPYLFADTVAANLRLARPEATDEELFAAARLAHADEFIRQLPQGYDTPIGERGVRLSGGQAQRIALARAFLQDASILVFDEPTAHLDPATEALIAASLERLTATGRAVLVIAHRPQTIARADQVVRLEKGRVVEVHRVKRQPAPAPVDTQPQAANSHSPLVAGKPERMALNVSPPSSPLSPFRPLLSFVLRSSFYRILLSVGLGFAAIAAGMGLMSISAYIIAAAARHPSVAMLQVAIVGVRFFGLSRGIFRYLERLTSHDLTFRLLARLRGWFYRAVEPRAPFLDRHSGDLLARALGDINSLENFYVRGVAPPLVAVCLSLGAAAFLGRFSPSLAISLLGFLALGGIVTPGVIRWQSRAPGAKLVAARARLEVVLVDTLQGMADLLAFGAVERQRAKVAAASQQVMVTQGVLARLNGLQNALEILCANVGMLTIVMLSIPRVHAGQLDGVLLPVLALWALTSFEAVQPLPQAALYLEANLQSAGRLTEITSRPPAVSEPAIPRTLPAVFDLHVHNLTFTYPDGTRALQNITCHLPPGAHVALVGASGSGKTTLLNLLLRLWGDDQRETMEDERAAIRPSAIMLNGLPLSDYSPSALRRQLACVPQQTYLFSATVKANLLLARPDASQEQIEQAARIACIHDFILSLPQGYETWVGEHGLRLSGGERQRLAIARAVLKDAPLMILDEPTAHLDAATEQAVLTNLHSYLAGRSALWASHRLTGMEWFDEILVFEGGRLVERGTHADLWARSGVYQRLWRNSPA